MTDKLDVLNQPVVNANNDQAKSLRNLFAKNHNFVLNIIGGPGVGKTTLITGLIAKLTQKVAVIEADMACDFDTVIVKKLNIPVEQINTVNACHLNARQIAKVVRTKPEISSAELILIENVGNLICPTEFYLGEDLQVIVFSVTDGDNKPLKYPVSFHKADIVVITKLDLLPYVNFDLDLAKSNIHNLNNKAKIFTVSAMNSNDHSSNSDTDLNALVEYITQQYYNKFPKTLEDVNA